jgi:hypothetical protein
LWACGQRRRGWRRVRGAISRAVCVSRWRLDRCLDIRRLDHDLIVYRVVYLGRNRQLAPLLKLFNFLLLLFLLRRLFAAAKQVLA